VIPRSSADLYRRQQQLTVATLAAVRSQWRRVGTRNLEDAWRDIGPRLTLLVAAAQLGAARHGAAYVPRVLEETGQDGAAVATVRPRAFAGTASDGRPLGSLLYGAVVRAGQAYNAGAATPQALQAGQSYLDMVTQTQVADASRNAAEAATIARPSVGGWVRQVNPPCCKRCAVLAGRFYRWSSGFERHPHDDCFSIPASEDVAGDLTTDPQMLLERGQITDLTETQRRALDEGADLNRVVNARRNMASSRRFDRIYRGDPPREVVIGRLRAAGFIT